VRVRLAAHGGFAGGLARPERVVDLGQLDPAQAESLARAVKAAITESAGRAAESREPLPDAMSYSITIEDAGEPTTLVGGDGDMPPQFAQLLSELQRALRR
jgi:hypothetical protein